MKKNHLTIQFISSTWKKKKKLRPGHAVRRSRRFIYHVFRCEFAIIEPFSPVKLKQWTARLSAAGGSSKIELIGLLFVLSARCPVCTDVDVPFHPSFRASSSRVHVNVPVRAPSDLTARRFWQLRCDAGARRRAMLTAHTPLRAPPSHACTARPAHRYG